MSNDARIVTRIDASTLMIDDRVERILGRRTIQLLFTVERLFEEWCEIELVGKGDEG